MSMPGGFGGVKDGDSKSQDIANQVKSQVEEKIGKNCTNFEVVNYTTQVVQGYNYKMKIKIDGDEYIHVKVFQALPCYGGGLEVKEAEGGHNKDSAL